MSLDISYYRKINNSYNVNRTVSKKESDIYTLKLHMANTFSVSLDYHDETLRNMVKQRFVISYYKDENKRKITAFPDELLNLGDKIDCFNSKWLVIYLNPDQQVYTKGIIQQCNYNLKFQNGTSTILEEPCIVLSQSDSLSGEDTGNIITIPSTQRVIYIQYNTNTAKLVEGKRLYIDQLSSKPKVYKITNIDRITKMNGSNGLWKLVCDEDQNIQSDDRPDILIANYITSSDTTTPPSSTDYICKITNTLSAPIEYNNDTNIATVKVGGSLKPFMCHFYDSTGTEITTLTPVWSIDVSGLTIVQQAKIHLTYNASYPLRCYLNVDNDNSLIGLDFILNLSSSDGLYHNSIQVKVVSLT